eukprot:3648941-Rhodomonas_salina.1
MSLSRVKYKLLTAGSVVFLTVANCLPKNCWTPLGISTAHSVRTEFRITGIIMTRSLADASS